MQAIKGTQPLRPVSRRRLDVRSEAVVIPTGFKQVVFRSACEQVGKGYTSA